MRKEKIVIEKMKPEHLQEVYEIEKKSYISPWPMSIFLNELKNKYSYYIVLKIDGKIVGYAGMNCIMQDAHITNLTVHPQFRRRGFGEILLLCLIHHTISIGARWITLEVRVSNIAAINLYKKYNFREAGMRKNYYLDTNEDALIMWSEDLFREEVKEKFINLYNNLNIVRKR